MMWSVVIGLVVLVFMALYEMSEFMASCCGEVGECIAHAPLCHGMGPTSTYRCRVCGEKWTLGG